MKINPLHLDIDKPHIFVIGKGRKIRALYILPKGVAYQKKYMEEFHSVNPNPESVNKQLKKYATLAHGTCKDVPLNQHAHQIRHAKASHWLEDGMNIVQISFLLGHANLHTTMVYLDITTEQESEALATLEDEKTKNIPKKWKSQSSSLAAFLGIKDIVNK